MDVLRQVRTAVASGESTEDACRAAGIAAATYYRWRREYQGVRLDQALRLKKLEEENARLRRVVSQLCLEKLALKEFAVKSV